MYLKHVPIPTLFMNCNWNRRDPCCHVRSCPLVPAWATTIHKFQGFEAGHDENDRFKYLIIDPGYKGWEQLHPGALYVALSRGKNMSNVYWVGHGMCIDRIMDGTNKIDKTKGNKGKKTLCESFKKRENWVIYLRKKKDEQATDTYTEERRVNINSVISDRSYSSQQVITRISDIVTNPNANWKVRKNSKTYKVPCCFND